VKSKIALALLLPGFVLVASIVGCNGGSYTPPPPPPVITVTISVANNITFLEAGSSVAITAVATGDTSGKGVSWGLSPMTGTLTNITSSSVTYNAPATPPANDIAVTITATSVSDPTKSAAASIDVPPIVVTLSPSVNPVGAGGTSVITATVTNDPANKPVDPASWTISPTTGAGTLSNPTSTSVTYTAPAIPPSSDVQVTITATSASPPATPGSAQITFAAIAVSLSANPGSVQFCPSQPCPNGTSMITATVSFDPANMGVDPTSWTITSPMPAVGTLSNPTTTSVTYTASATPPPADVPVTITATSISAPKQTGSVTVTVLAISISVSPTSALIPVNNGSVQFVATTGNDPASPSQANWTLLQNGTLCAAGCGTLSPTTTASGTATTYTPPSTVPASPAVTLTATSVTDNTKSASAAITLTNGTVQLVPDILAFGPVKTTRSKPLTTTLTNTGASALSITSVTITGSPFTQTNTCGSSVAAAASCVFTVTFKPTQTLTYNGALTITDSSADSPQKVALTGRGVFFRFNSAETSALAANRFPSTPLPTGPNPVGTQVLDLVDPTRNDPFLSGAAKRELLVRMWYPASPGQSCSRADYASPRVWTDFSRLVGAPLPQVTTNSCWNTSISDGAHPVVVFTHGFTGTFTDYTFLFEDLASRGYVVASVDHTFEATAVEFPDGRFAESVFGSHLANIMRADEQSMDYAVSVRLDDLNSVVNALESLNAGGSSTFAGKLDMSRVALAGHSLGGMTAILGVEQDSRFRAGVVLDGVVPNSSLSGTETPMLLLTAGRDTWTEDETRLWSGLRGPRTAVNLRGAEHLTISDAVWLAAGAIKTGSMGPNKTIAAIRNYVAAFLDANLLDKEPDPLLTGPSSEFPDATVTTRKELLRAKY